MSRIGTRTHPDHERDSNAPKQALAGKGRVEIYRRAHAGEADNLPRVFELGVAVAGEAAIQAANQNATTRVSAEPPDRAPTCGSTFNDHRTLAPLSLTHPSVSRGYEQRNSTLSAVDTD